MNEFASKPECARTRDAPNVGVSVGNGVDVASSASMPPDTLLSHELKKVSVPHPIIDRPTDDDRRVRSRLCFPIPSRKIHRWKLRKLRKPTSRIRVFADDSNKNDTWDTVYAYDRDRASSRVPWTSRARPSSVRASSCRRARARRRRRRRTTASSSDGRREYSPSGATPKPRWMASRTRNIKCVDSNDDDAKTNRRSRARLAKGNGREMD